MECTFCWDEAENEIEVRGDTVSISGTTKFIDQRKSLYFCEDHEELMDEVLKHFNVIEAE